MVLLTFLYTNTIMLCDLVQLVKTHLQFFQLGQLLVPELLSLQIFFIELLQLLCQIGKSLSCVLDLLHNVGLVLGHDVVQLLLALQLVDLKLALELFLLHDFLFGYS